MNPQKGTKQYFAQLGKSMMLLSTYEDYDIAVIIEVLVVADEMYYNDEESFLTDAEYDALREYAKNTNSANSYFLKIGSTVRGGKIDLPHPMGSLDQVQIGEILDWISNWSLQNEWTTISDKLDGTSAMIVYNRTGDLQIAYSRGDGHQGADITRHIKRIPSVPQNVGRAMTVRGEVIMKKASFTDVQSKIQSQSGRVYKNARNMTAGIMNSSKNKAVAYQALDFLAYEIVDEDLAKDVMFTLLQDSDFLTPNWATHIGSNLDDKYLANFLNVRRAKCEYEIDGLVIDVQNLKTRTRMNPTRDTLNPACTIKYKVADATNLAVATVVKVHWKASGHGYLKPRVEIEPLDLVGVTITFATGFNAKFISDKKVGPGAKIEITRAGDVIPFIKSVVTGTTAMLPDEDYTWVPNGDDEPVDIILDNHENSRDVKIEQLLSFFSSIEAPLLKRGSLTKLYDAGWTTTEVIIQLSEATFVGVLGSNGSKIYHGLHKVLTDIPVWKLMGSTFFFGRGMGKRKMKKLLANVANPANILHIGVFEIAAMDGFDDTSAQKIVNGVEDYYLWAGQLISDGFITVDYDVSDAGGALAGYKIVFTGFRDKALQAQVESEGGTMQSAASSKTTMVVAADPNANSGKLKKARSLGVNIIGVDELKKMIGA